ncbi:MAG: MFS transporter, partial [Firmicutes bacterium]|nr:MFS transporter [Bacillota bacterium]
MEQQEKKIAGFSHNVVFLGIVSFLTDIASEMIYPVLPLFLSAIGVSKSFIGFIEGIAETTASVLKVFSGWISDKFKKRKFLILLGYGISAITKPVLVFATAGWHVLVLRFLDRTGKGIRTSPRDALIADSTEESQRGKAFGLHRTMDTAGAVIGPLIASLVLMMNAGKVNSFFKAINPQEGLFRFIFLLSIIPGVFAVIFLVFSIKETFKSSDDKGEPPLKGWASLDHKFIPFLIIAAIFTLANSSDAFLLLRAQATGVSIAHIPLIWLLFNMVYTILATPFGALSDKIGRRKVIIG